MYKPQPTTNNAIAKDPEEKDIFALMAMDNIDFEVTISLPLSSPRSPNKPVITSYNAMD